MGKKGDKQDEEAKDSELVPMVLPFEEAVYRSTVVRHLVEAYAAKAAGGSCAARTWAGVV